jgi:hypothetical protein
MALAKEEHTLLNGLHQSTQPLIATMLPTMSANNQTSSQLPPSPPPKTIPEPLLITSSFWGRTVHIHPLSSPNPPTTYKIHLRNHAPQYTFEDSHGAAIATCTSLTGKSLSFTFPSPSHTHSFTILLHSLFINTEFAYSSPAFGQDLVWKSATPGPVGEIACVTAGGGKVGRFVQRTLYKEVGVLEFGGLDGVGWTDGMRDEFVVVGTVLAWLRITQSSPLLVGAAKVFSG